MFMHLRMRVAKRHRHMIVDDIKFTTIFFAREARFSDGGLARETGLVTMCWREVQGLVTAGWQEKLV